MKPIVQIFVAFTVLSITFPNSDSASYYGLSFNPWGWSRDNVTKVITPPSLVKQYPLTYPFKQCNSEMEGLMTRLFVYPCHLDHGRCKLARGDNVTLDLEFLSNIHVDNLKGSLGAILSNWFSSLKLADPEDLCKSGQIKCPVQPLHPYRYRISIFIPLDLSTLYPNPDIEVIIRTDTGRTIACAIVPVTIADLTRDGLSDETAQLAEQRAQ